jgi:hypothetical protein
VGAALLRGEWQAAVRLIMEAGQYERADAAGARQLYLRDGDIKVWCAAGCGAPGVLHAHVVHGSEHASVGVR